MAALESGIAASNVPGTHAFVGSSCNAILINESGGLLSRTTSMAEVVEHYDVAFRKKVLVLDLDETLVHSSFEKPAHTSFTVELKHDGQSRKVYVSKRPYVDEFLLAASKMFDIVIFTAGLAEYANPVIDALDIQKVCKGRLFRDSCIYWNGLYIKNLEIFQRSLSDVIIVDNAPSSYCLHPNNAIPIESWYDDQCDIELLKLFPLLTILSQIDDVSKILRQQYKDSSYSGYSSIAADESNTISVSIE